MADVSRRTLIRGTGALGASMLPAALRPDCGTAPEPPEHGCSATHYPADPRTDSATSAQSQTYLFLNDEEAAFIEAAVARLIPKDEQWAGALEAGVPNYIDKQLAGAWGAGERLYRNGPWQPGTPSQGYPLPFTPPERFRTALAAIDKDLAEPHRPLARQN